MKTIYKYPLVPDAQQTLMFSTKRVIHLVGTGHEVPAGKLAYIDTFQTGPYVFHVFEEIS